MNNIISAIVLMIVIYLCATAVDKKQPENITDGVYVSIDTGVFRHKQQAYVPVNAPPKRNTRTQIGKTILKIRNTSFSDSLYLSRIEYYDAHGILLKNLIDSSLLVRPMATKEILVKGNEFKRRGDNFVVQWFLNDPMHKPIIEVVSFDIENRMLIRQDYVLLNTPQ